MGARFREVAQPEIRWGTPVAVLDQARKVEIDPTELSEAPKRATRSKALGYLD